MRKYNLLTVLVATLSFLLPIWVFAADFDHFEIKTSPESFGVNESVDLTLRALWDDGKTYTEYKWVIMVYSTTESSLALPNDGTYEFTDVDAWIKKFEDSLKFSSAWEHILEVLDTNSYETLWTITFNVKDSASVDTATVVENGDWEKVEVTYPTPNLTIWKSEITVTWISKENHKLTISVNDEKKGEAISNDKWEFSFDLKDLVDGENTLTVSILDADENEIGKSDALIFSIDSQLPLVIDFGVSPDTVVEAGETLTITLKSNPGLVESKITLWDVITNLKETEAWVYTWNIAASETDWEYFIGVTLKNSIWNVFTKSNFQAIIVEEKEEEVVVEEPVELNVAEEPVEEEIDLDALQKKLEIKNITLLKLAKKSVLKWDNIEEATSYDVYKKDKSNGQMLLVEKVTQPHIDIAIAGEEVTYDDFAVKAVIDTEEIKLESKDYSDMTKVQTGPAQMMILLLSIMIATGMIVVGRKRA